MEYAPQIIRDGKFIEPDQSKLTPQAIKALDVVRTAFNRVENQERVVAACQEEITAALSAVAAAERLVAPYGAYDFHRLWLETIKGRGMPANS